MTGGINGPFGILRRAVASLYLCSKPRQGAYLLIREARFVVSLCQYNPLRPASWSRANNNALIAQTALNDLAGRRIGHKMIGIDGAGDHSLSETGAGVDHRLTALAGKGMSREEHASCNRINHLLDHHSQAHGRVIDAQALTVTDGPVGPQRSPAAFHRFEHRFDADDIEVGILLTGKTGEGQVFSRSRRAHSHRDRPAFPQLLIRLSNCGD